MRYKSAKGILLEIAVDEQAPTWIRLAAAEMLVKVDQLPELKGYKRGSPESLLLRLASDLKTPAKDRFKALQAERTPRSTSTELKVLVTARRSANRLNGG